MSYPLRTGGGDAFSFLGRPCTVPSCASHSKPFTTRRFQSSNRSRKHATSRRENDVFVRPLASTNPNTLDEHCVALLPTFSSLQTTMCRLWNPDKNDFRERYDLMSVMLTTGLLARRHSVALRFVSTSPQNAAAMPRSVCPRQNFYCCQIASGNPHESSEFVPQQPEWHAQQDWMLNCASVSSRISPDLPPYFSLCLPEPPLPAIRQTSTVRACERSPQ